MIVICIYRCWGSAPSWLAFHGRRVQPIDDLPVEGAVGEELVQNLKGLTRGIPDYARLADVPFAYHRHTIGVPTRIHHLLRRLVREVTCYHEHHRDSMPRFHLCIFFERHVVSSCIRMNMYYFLDYTWCKTHIYLYICLFLWPYYVFYVFLPSILPVTQMSI